MLFRSDIADYFKHEIGYNIPTSAPFIGRDFNVTRAGIHADGLLKDEEIYNIFNTEKILGRAASVLISKTSGLAGIAYWINDHYELKGDEQVAKNDELVIALKEWVDEMYEGGRVTMLAVREITDKIEELAPGRFQEC